MLGRGGMGTVYRARDPILDRMVALKTVSAQHLASEDARVRFQREARAAARLQHPNIVTIFELGEADGALFIAMELLPGMDLVEAMVPPDRLPLDEKLRAMVQVCRGLDFAHKRGVIHRDVKPANVRLLPDGTVKLVDFGIARMGESTVTQTGIVLGTPSYLAPEVLATDRVDFRADMWSVGVVLHELATGKRPFQAPTFAALAYKIVHEALPPLDPSLSLPDGLPQAIGRALAKEPAARFTDLAEMAVALERALGVTPGMDILTPQARHRSSERSLDEARRLAEAGEVERALEAARRAQALQPDVPEAAELADALEKRLAEEGTRADRELPLLDGTLVTEVTPARRPPTAPIATEIRARGASAFRELVTFGEPPATQVVALSPVKDVLATGGADGAIRLWDLRAHTRLAVLRSEMHQRTGHDARPLALAFSPDGALLAAGHVDGAIHVWDLNQNAELPARPRHEGIVACLAFSPDGAELASGGMDSVVKVWEVETARRGEARRRIVRQPAPVNALVYAGGGSWLLTGHSNKLLRLLDAQSGRLLATLRGPEAPVITICRAPDGRHVVVASQDRTLRVFDLEQKSAVAVLTAQRKAATSLCYFPDGEHLATVALDNAVNLWHLGSPDPLAQLWGPAAESFAGVTVYRGGDHLAVALSDGRIRLWGPGG